MPGTKTLPVREIPLGAMISIIDRTHFVILNERLRPFGISAGQFPVIISLIKKQNVMQDTLARHFHIDKGAVARAVIKLVHAGYVRRIPDPENRRAVRLFLTEKGEQIAPEIEKIDREWEEMMYSSLTKEDRLLFSLLIRRITDSCRETLEKTEG
ncbi:MAG: MarR family transcriptional regulator [Methanoregula sp.]